MLGELRLEKEISVNLETAEESAVGQTPKEPCLSHFVRRFDGPKC